MVHVSCFMVHGSFSLLRVWIQDLYELRLGDHLLEWVVPPGFGVRGLGVRF